MNTKAPQTKNINQLNKLYNYKGQKQSFNNPIKIGEGRYGTIYKVSDEICLKLLKETIYTKNILQIIKELNLDNYYKIYDFYNDEDKNFIAYTMKYYIDEEIDILTMPIEYTIENLFKIKKSIEALSKNSILISDIHVGNIIMNKEDITIIDADLYTKNHFYNKYELRNKNLEELEYLFSILFIEAITDYHQKLKNNETINIIYNLFQIKTLEEIKILLDKIKRYKYPIDYIKRKTRKIFL